MQNLEIVPSYKDIPIRLCKTRKQVRTLIGYVKATGYCSFDFETNAKPIHKKEFIPTIVGISFQPGSRYVIPLAHFESPFKDNMEWLSILKELNTELFSNPKVVKLAQNAKFEYKILRKYGFNVYGELHDTMLIKHLLDENSRNDLKSVVMRLMPQYTNYDAELKTLLTVAKRQSDDPECKGWDRVELMPLSAYCALDADLTLRLFILLERRIMKDVKLYALYRNLAMMNVRVLGESETFGLRIDLPYLEKIYKEEGARIETNLKNIHKHKTVRRFEKQRKKEHTLTLVDKMTNEIKEYRDRDVIDNKVLNAIKHREEKLSRYIAGEFTTKAEQYGEFNLNSVKQLREFLHYSDRGLKLPIVDYTKDKFKKPTKDPSTAEETLDKLAHLDSSGFIEKLLTHRKLTKIYSTYIKGILERVNMDTSYLHGSFLIHGTVTGRLSSRDPNLQNMPRDTTSSLIKQMFKPPKGYVMIEMDYSQAELRYVAELSKDKAMIDIFVRGYNIHLATGLKLAGRMDDYDVANEARKDKANPDYEYWKKLHKRGKVMNFSILYQQSDKMTGETLEVSAEEAGEFKRIWFAQFPGVTRYLDRHVKKTKKLGYCVNAFGRHRRLPDIFLNPHGNKVNMGKYNAACREAINAPIQGGSSDYTQAAGIEIWEHRQMGHEPFKYAIYQCYTVHDSLGWYVRNDKVHEFVKEIARVGESPNIKPYYNFEFKKVKMKVSVEVGLPSWGDLTEYSPNTDYTKI